MQAEGAVSVFGPGPDHVQQRNPPPAHERRDFTAKPRGCAFQGRFQRVDPNRVHRLNTDPQARLCRCRSNVHYPAPLQQRITAGTEGEVDGAFDLTAQLTLLAVPAPVCGARIAFHSGTHEERIALDERYSGRGSGGIADMAISFV